MNVLVTGASNGIGRAIALEFLQNGHSVTGMDLCEASLTHPRYRHCRLDLCADPLPDVGAVEILVNNAGVQNTGRDIAVNLEAVIRVTERYAFTPAIRSVLFLASASARTGAEFAEYAASKGGVVAYMKNAALRLAQYGATANSLSPGGVRTALNDHILQSPALWAQVLDETLLHRWAEPEEIAQWAYFVTAVNRSMTAQDILIDNGEAAKSNFIW